MQSKCLMALALVSYGAVWAQPPAEDRRNTYRPNTDTRFRPPEYKSKSEWEARAKSLRKQVQVAAGLYPMPPKSPVKAEIFGKVERDGYTIEKVLLETMPGYYLGGNLYRPRDKAGPFPAVITPHGHWAYGRLENQQLASVPLRGINLARQGYVVFAYDMVGYNDTIQTPHVFGDRREQLWSFGPLQLQTWNSTRALDFVLSLAEVDRNRVGMTGASGGGTQTFVLTAIDDRVKFAAPVNMISLIMQGGSPCENAPGLRWDVNNVEIGALMAPRPLLMVSATGDWTRNTRTEEFPSIQQIYRLYGEEALVENVHVDAPHNYNKDSREAMYRFFAKHAFRLMSPGAEFKEKGAPVEKLGDLLALFNRKLPDGALTFDGVRDAWIARAKAQAPKSADEARDRLQAALGVEFPLSSTLHEDVSKGKVLLWREGKGDRLVGELRGKGNRVVVYENGVESVPGDENGLLLTVFQTGTQKVARPPATPFDHTFNRPDDANRVQDILTALSWMRQRNGDGVELVCRGKAGIWCTFAAALAPMWVRLDAPLGNFKGTDEDFLRDFFVPGIQRAGGLEAAKLILSQ
jgi:dienelactone hydrolase